MLKKYGNTVEKIKKDGIPITKIIPMYDENDLSNTNLGRAVGSAISNLTKTFKEYTPDLLIVVGDRFEALAAVIAASTLSIPIAHISGGDSVPEGQIDEQIRHAITKFSHLHFPSTKKSAERIKLLGEEEKRIHIVGAIAIDMLVQEILLTREDICKKLGLDHSKKIILCVQHPNFFEAENAGKQMRITLDVLRDLTYQIVIIYPNNDPGSNLILEEIKRCKKYPNFKIFKNLERTTYLSLMKNIDLLIGNSSSGPIESAIFKLPAVNIGNRNKGREHSENIINVPHDYEKIKEAIIKGLSDEFKSSCKNVKSTYGDGNASPQIVRILEDLEINKNFLIKKLTYNV